MHTTREIILQKAFLLFIQHGYNAISMSTLQKETGLSRGALYHHFKSKDELFKEVIETFYISAPTTTKNALDTSSLYNFYHGYWEHSVQVFSVLRETLKGAGHDNDFNFFMLGLDAMKRYPGFREKISFINAEVKKIWTGVVANARNKGEIHTKMTDEQVAEVFIFLSEGIGTHYTNLGKGAEAGEVLIKLWDSFYNEITLK